MGIHGGDNLSRIGTCLDAASRFLRSERQAQAIVEGQPETIARHWSPLCAQARLSLVDRRQLWGRLVLNGFATDDLDGERAGLKRLADAVRATRAV